METRTLDTIQKLAADRVRLLDFAERIATGSRWFFGVEAPPALVDAARTVIAAVGEMQTAAPDEQPSPWRRHDWCIGGCEGRDRCHRDPVCGN